MLRVDGQAALITGGSAGIGKATARVLAAAGAAVCLVARDQGRLDSAVAEIEAEGGRAIGVAGDAVAPETRELSVRRCIAELGSLDILVNNVGGGIPAKAVADMNEEEIRWITELNLNTTVFYSQLAWRSWMSEHGGAIVNIASLAGIIPRPGYGWYGVSKAAVAHLAKVLALEFAPKVRVNAIAPGMVVTELVRQTVTPEYLEGTLNRPLQRHGDPEHIAGTVLSLVAPMGAYTTGQLIAVDGGALLV